MPTIKAHYRISPVTCPRCRSNTEALHDDETEKILSVRCVKCPWRLEEVPRLRPRPDPQALADKRSVREAIAGIWQPTLIKCRHCGGSVLEQRTPGAVDPDRLQCRDCGSVNPVF
jgi:hypothetical protein